MAMPKAITLSKQQQSRALALFKGTKTQKGIKNARAIAEQINAPYRQVMRLLEVNKLRRYSPTSY